MGSRAVIWLLAGVLVISAVGCAHRSEDAATREADQALIRAAYEGDLQRVRSLLQAGANANPPFRGDPKLFAHGGTGYPGVAYAYTPMLALACRDAKPEDLAIASLLLRHSADIDVDDGKGGSPLLWAVLHQNAPLGMWLIEQGANPHRIGGPYHHGVMMSPLHTACELQPKLAIAMIDHGADPNARLQGIPPLATAAYDGQVEVVRRLLDAGADPNAHQAGFHDPRSDGEWVPADPDDTPLTFAARGFAHARPDPDQRYLDVLELLLAAGAREGVDEALWRLAVEVPFRISLLDSDEQPALSPVETDRVIAVVRKLIEAGADVNRHHTRLLRALFEEDRPRFVLLALLEEAWVGAPGEPGRLEQSRQLTLQLAQLLVEAGADLKVSADDGQTPLHLATYIGEPKLIELLLRHGASVDARDTSGATPLMMLMPSLEQYRNAAEYYEAARTLVAAGARLTPQEIQPYQAWIDQATEIAAELEGEPTYDPRLRALLNSASSKLD